MLGDNIPRAHAAFNIIGLLAFSFVGSVLMFWPYRYGCYMLPKRRRNKIFAGVAVTYFTHVLPCWMIEFSIVWSYGWFELLQGVSFILLTVTWILETVAVWHAYTWHMAGFMQIHYDNTLFGRGTTKAEAG